MALLQNSLKLATITFLNFVLVYFRGLAKFLTNQEKKFLWLLRLWIPKDLIDYWINSRNHPQKNGLVE